MSNFNKLAYGAYFDEGEYDRWLDGGQAYGFNKNDAVRLTKLFADEAAKRKAKLMFMVDLTRFLSLIKCLIFKKICYHGQ